MSRPATFVLGTAGHIDHGKTSLVQALTGVDTDRWKEEKERGITIDLGFARLALGQGTDIAIVDVPGHEAFVRNMLAGASGLDAALLVVAADEGPMPQTLEHLAILDLMGIDRGVVALTKRDLVDAEWAELVEDEVTSLLRGTSLEGAPIIATSATGEAGVADLRGALEALAAEVIQRSVDDLFRMPIDRAFSVRGTGTVVTGTVWSGTAKVGDRVHVAPGAKEARIRRIHAFGEEVTAAIAGSRAALALTGVERDDAPRGTNVVNVVWWEPTVRFTARIRMTAGAALLVPDQRVRVHLGTAEVMARVHPFGSEDQRSSEAVWAEVRLEEPLLVRGGDRFVIRSYSPVTTIGGGVVLEPFPPRRRMKSVDPTDLALSGGSAADRLHHALEVAGDAGLRREEVALWTGVGQSTDPGHGSEAAWVEGGDRVFARSSYDRLRKVVLTAVAEAHEQSPLEPGAPIEALRRLDEGGGILISTVIADLEREGALESEAGWVRETGVVPTLSVEHRTALDRLTSILRDAGLAAPKVDELKDSFGESTDNYVAYLVRQNEAVRLPDDFIIAREVLNEAAELIRERFGGREGLGPADFREVLPVSRRHLVPILSHMDVIGVTVRRTNSRDVPV